MKSALAVLLLTASSVALLTIAAPPAAATRLAAPRVPSGHSPASGLMLRTGHLREAQGGSVVTSHNWAGYDVTGGGYSTVTASWIQPAIRPSSTGVGSHACFWVGLDGDGSSTVEQTGTWAYTQNGSVTYYAWYEMYPNPVVRISSVSVSPGNAMTASVASDGDGYFTLTIRNDSTGQTSATTQYSTVAQSYSAEVIAEAPSSGSGDQYPLADFGAVNFTGCAIDGQAISAYDWSRINMISNAGAAMASTSALGGAGTSFSVSTYTADVTAPTTAVLGADGRWHRKAVTLMFSANDEPGGSGVAYTEYSLDGGATWTRGTSCTVGAPTDHSNDGIHTIRYRSADYLGNVESTRTRKVRIDTLGPTTKALASASVRRGRTVTLRYRVSDALSPQARVTIRIMTPSGRTVKTLPSATRTTKSATNSRFTCNLARGKYRFMIEAKDLAGNGQVKRGYGTMVVR